MSELKAIQPQSANQPKPKILIYGKPGVGKTWGTLDFPHVYYIDTESGASLPHYVEKLVNSGGVYMGPEQGATDFDTVIGQVKALATEKHTYKTLVIDSVSKLFNAYIGEEIDRLGDRDQYGASKKKPVSAMKRLVSWLSKLDMNVILVAHEKIEYGVDSKNERVPVGDTFDCWDKLEYELDLCMRIVKAGANRNAFVRKSRLQGFPEGEHFQWSYEDFAEKYGVQAITRESETLDLATQDQIQQIKDIFATKKIPADLESRWFLKANVSGWDEMPRQRVDAAISYLNENF